LRMSAMSSHFLRAPERASDPKYASYSKKGVFKRSAVSMPAGRGERQGSAYSKTFAGNSRSSKVVSIPFSPSTYFKAGGRNSM
jgi:hypothetical protein